MSRQLPDWIDGFLELTKEVEAPKSFRTWVAVSCVAAALQRKCRFELGSLTFYPNMYIVLVAPPGRCRKGTIIKPGLSLLRELGIRIASESITREALIREIKESTAMEVYEETGEIDTHSSLTVISPELSVFLGHNNPSLLMDLTDWFDCASTWVYRTKHQGTDDIYGIWLNLLGATTPELLGNNISRDLVGGGLMSRMIIVYEKDRIISPLPYEDPDVREKLLNDLREIHMLRGVFKPKNLEFLEYYIDWYQKSEQNPPIRDPLFAGYLQRRPTHILKLATIMSASRGDSMALTIEDFQRAENLISLTEEKMPDAFSAYGRRPDIEVVNRIMMEIAAKKKVRVSYLLSVFHRDVDYRGMENIIRTLIAKGFCKQHLLSDGNDFELIYTDDKKKETSGN